MKLYAKAYKGSGSVRKWYCEPCAKEQPLWQDPYVDVREHGGTCFGCTGEAEVVKFASEWELWETRRNCSLKRCDFDLFTTFLGALVRAGDRRKWRGQPYKSMCEQMVYPYADEKPRKLCKDGRGFVTPRRGTETIVNDLVRQILYGAGMGDAEEIAMFLESLGKTEK